MSVHMTILPGKPGDCEDCGDPTCDLAAAEAADRVARKVWLAAGSPPEGPEREAWYAASDRFLAADDACRLRAAKLDGGRWAQEFINVMASLKRERERTEQWHQRYLAAIRLR